LYSPDNEKGLKTVVVWVEIVWKALMRSIDGIIGVWARKTAESEAIVREPSSYRYTLEKY